MRVIASSGIIQARIEASFQRILNNCTGGVKSNLSTLPIIITDDKKAEEIYRDGLNLFRRAYSEGFGGVKGNISYLGNRFHLVVLNLSNVDRFHLDDQELDGILSHELGHIFNENPKREMPSILKGNTKTEIENAKVLFLKEMEMYADYFSKITGTSGGLLSSMNKYLASGDCLNRELFDERIGKLNSTEEFTGSIKPVT